MKSFILPKIAGPACESGILGRKLTSIYIPGEHGSAIPDIKKGNHARIQGTPTYSTNFGYRNLASASSSNNAKATCLFTGYPMVFVAIGYVNNTAGNWQLSNCQNSGGGGGYAASLRVDSSTNFSYRHQVNFGTAANASVNITTVSNRLITCIAQSLSRTDHRVYINGLSATSSTDVGAWASNFVEYYVQGSTSCNGGTILSGFGSIPFTDEEAILLTSHPELMIAEIINSRNIVHLNSGSGTTFNITPSGSIVFSGSVTQNHEHIQSTSGSIIFSGTNNQVHEKNIVPTGSVVFSGGSSIIYTPSGGTTYTITPNGTITFNGTVLQNHEHILNTSGNIVFSGSIDTIKTKVVTPTGNIIFSGTAPITIPGAGPEPTTKLPLTGIGV